VAGSCDRAGGKNCQADRYQEKKQPHSQIASYQGVARITNNFGKFGRYLAIESDVPRECGDFIEIGIRFVEERPLLEKL
jgi:hypothetical protein